MKVCKLTPELRSTDVYFGYRGESPVLGKRAFDLLFALFLILLLWPLLLVIAVVVKVTSPGPVLRWSSRVGRNNKLFLMPKFRSMHRDAPQITTHLLKNADCYVTPLGRFLRRMSLDELPQLFSIVGGDLSFVGPRPALFNQDDLVKMRTERGVHVLTPGLTGWAQVNGRNMLPVPAKVLYDCEYSSRQSLGFDMRILVTTVVKVLRCEGVTH